MTIGYETPPAGSPATTHDHIYSTLLGVFTFFLIVGILTLATLRSRLAPNPDTEFAIRLVLLTEGCFAAAMLSVLLLRLVFPKYRKWPTLGLNIILLVLVPFGTALAIYGFWKVDKRLPG